MNQRKGDNMFADEQFLEAVYYYEKALAEKPSSSDLTAKLSIARSKLIAAELIDVRMLRQSSQQKKAALKLNMTLEKINSWSISADSAVKHTMNEEVTFASNWISGQLNDYAQKSKFNEFMLVLANHNYITDSGLSSIQIEKNQPKMMKMGANYCSAISSELTTVDHFYQSYVSSYCSVFGVVVDHKLGAAKHLYSRPIIVSSLQIDKKVGVSSHSFSKKLENDLSKSLWFNYPSSKTLAIKLSGNVKYNLKTSNTQFKVNYLDKQEVFEYTKNKDTGKTKKKRVKVKKVKKSITIHGKRHLEKTSHNVMVNLTMFNGANIVSFGAENINETTSHETTFKSEKIRPKKAKYINKEKWFNNIYASVEKESKNGLNDAWSSSFCDNKINISKNENKARCSAYLAIGNKPDAWFKSKFGVSYKELEALKTFQQ